MGIRLDKTGFGQIEIYQNPDEFCYGVDAVLLADFAAKLAKAIKKTSKIIDLGTGTGIVPLILSHKTMSDNIKGVEVQKNSFDLAIRNIEINNLQQRIWVYNEDVVNFDCKEQLGFDIVTTNPPYTKDAGGIKSANTSKAIARHETTASLEDFIRVSSLILKDKGDFFMVHRPARLIDICEYCRRYRLEPKELQFVSGKPMEKPNIILIHCVKNGNKELKLLRPLAVHNEDGEYSEEILSIYEKK